MRSRRVHRELSALTAPAAIERKGEAPKIDACAHAAGCAGHSACSWCARRKGDRRDSGVESNGAYSSSCVWLLTARPRPHADPRAPLGSEALRDPERRALATGQRWRAPYSRRFARRATIGVIASKALTLRAFGGEALWWGDGLAVRRRRELQVSVFVPRKRVGSKGYVGICENVLRESFWRGSLRRTMKSPK